ncbi:MAG: hypothetical protein JSV23_09325 [Promethearchaeota archaeon]|nr:MAG: hypothetical protein JSV23_09325 [Candidatus Lokiarchaeota archaeon]
MFKSKNLEPKSYLKVNYVSYIFIYLNYTSIFVFLNNYFPILFFDVLDINRFLLAFMQFLAYSVLLLRPAFAFITDKYKIKGYQRRYYIIFSGYIFVLFYILMGLSFSNIFLFGVFLFLIFLSSTMLDVSTKSLIIDISETKEERKYAFFFIAFGQAIGNSIPLFLFVVLINDIHSINSWYALFISSFIFLIPLLSILPFISEKRQIESLFIESSEIFDFSNPNNLANYPNFKKILALVCIFVFFAFSDVIFAFPFFPFLLTKFGPIKFNLFNFILTFYFLINILSSAIGTFIIKRTSPKKIILILIPIIGSIYILYTIVDFPIFIILYFMGCSLATITNLNISVYVMKFKKANKSIYFHLIASFKNLSIFIFLPLGTLLSNIINTEFIIIIGAIILNLSIIPLTLIKL